MKKPRKIVVSRADTGPQSSINVTPLVDVVLVLLIIFMVVMPLMEKNFTVNIPKTEQTVEPSEVPPDQVIVNIDREGELSINGARVPRESYMLALQSRLGARPQQDRIVFVSSDAEAGYTRLIEAFEGARRAGAETLALITEPPGGATEEAPPSAAPAEAPTP